MESRKILSFDAETNGLWGQAFSIGALVYDENGVEIARFVSRCPIEGAVDEFVAEKVLPQMTAISETQDGYKAMLSEFAKFYLENKDDADIIVHVGVPVEAKVLTDMHSLGCIGDWDGPFPLLDVAGLLAQAGEDPTSVDNYCQKYGIIIDASEFAGGTHNPLYDSEVAARVYMHLRRRIV